jgi:hypothetical protein
MKNFQNELLSISKSISELAIQTEALAEYINEEYTEKNPTQSSMPSETTAKVP